MLGPQASPPAISARSSITPFFDLAGGDACGPSRRIHLPAESLRHEGILLPACLRCFPSFWWCFLHVLIKPGDHFIKHMHETLPAGVAVSFKRQHHQTHCGAMSLQCLVHTFRLDWKSSRVVIGLTVCH